MSTTLIEVSVLVELERRRFEQHARDHIQFANLERDGEGLYTRKSMRDCWQCWLAALKIEV
jgi:hypothetical protein